MVISIFLDRCLSVFASKLSLLHFSGKVLAATVATDYLTAVLHSDSIGANRSALGALRGAALRHLETPCVEFVDESNCL